MGKLRGLLVFGKWRVSNAWIRELCGVVKGAGESVLLWFGHIKRYENERIAKRMHAGKFVGSRFNRSTAEEVD